MAVFIDPRVIERMVYAAIKAGVTIAVYAPGEPVPEGESAWVQIEPVSGNTSGCAGGGAESPDSAEIEIRCTIGVADSETRGDVFQIGTAIGQVLSAARRRRLSDSPTSHFIDIYDARQDGQAVADESGRIRSASVVISATAYRIAGSSLE